jgi:manganese-dependent inorganic pyrophosphatase
METIVIGHKNPDMDSICSAIAYAHLKRETGMTGVCAARAGATNERIDFVLRKFGVEPPVFISDLSPRVEDVMQRDVISINAESPIYEALQLVEEHRLRGLPVIDQDRRCLGLLSTFKICHYFFPPRGELSHMRETHATLPGIAESFEGRIVTRNPEAGVRHYLLAVAAMRLESYKGLMGRFRGRDLILVVGDRTDIQIQAIADNVRAIVVTGGLPIEDAVREAAEAAGVAMLSSPCDTATTLSLARGAVHVSEMLNPEFTSFSPETPLHVARERVGASAEFVFPVLDEQGALIGILSKSDFIKPVPRQLVLVDHNELSQAVAGADMVPIIEILDHHRLAGFSTDTPILFWNNPVGSTSTIISLCYEQAGVPIPRPIAGLLMAGLISDTLNLTSPTATEVDRRILSQLEAITGLSAAALSEQIFSVGSPLLTLSADQVITADCKEYEEDGTRFTVSQIEELNFTHFFEKQHELLLALERHCARERLYFSAILVTDVNSQDSVLLLAGEPEFLALIDFPTRGPNMWELKGVVSRKKQLLPYLLGRLEIAARASGR